VYIRGSSAPRQTLTLGRPNERFKTTRIHFVYTYLFISTIQRVLRADALLTIHRARAHALCTDGFVDIIKRSVYTVL
jgi:hypothetical protein